MEEGQSSGRMGSAALAGSGDGEEGGGNFGCWMMEEGARLGRGF